MHNNSHLTNFLCLDLIWIIFTAGHLFDIKTNHCWLGGQGAPQGTALRNSNHFYFDSWEDFRRVSKDSNISIQLNCFHVFINFHLTTQSLVWKSTNKRSSHRDDRNSEEGNSKDNVDGRVDKASSELQPLDQPWFWQLLHLWICFFKSLLRCWLIWHIWDWHHLTAHNLHWWQSCCHLSLTISFFYSLQQQHGKLGRTRVWRVTCSTMLTMMTRKGKARLKRSQISMVVIVVEGGRLP